MFIPIGGVFVFGGCNSRSCIIHRIIIGLINLVMGAIALGFGYSYDLLFLKIIGYVIAFMGLMMILFNLFGLKSAKVPPQPEH